MLLSTHSDVTYGSTFFPELNVICGTGAVAGRQTFECVSNNQLASVVCSFDGGPEETCSFPLVVEIGRFGTEEHTVVVNATDVFGQSQILTFNFQLIERKSSYVSSETCVSMNVIIIVSLLQH